MKEERSNFHRIRYLIKENDFEKYSHNLMNLIKQQLDINSNHLKEVDEELHKIAARQTHIDSLVDRFQLIVTAACKKSFRSSKTTIQTHSNKTVPWWKNELTLMRKRLNALRRRFQRTKNDEDLQHQRKIQYEKIKKEYQSKIRREKINSWKEYCTLTTTMNPWNAAYKLATGKLKTNTLLTTLRKNDGTYTKDLSETINHMLDTFITADEERNDSEQQKQTREKTKEPPDTPNDKPFTIEEVRNILEGIDHKKAPGEDGITSNILLHTFTMMPKFITEIYNQCLKTGTFPKIWKRAVIIPITKPGLENKEEVTKFRPISLLNVAGKVLEKLLINRIMHHLNTGDFLNRNQFGFTPQTGTIDAIMAVKNFIEETLKNKQHVAMISLDVKGAFDAAWWPSILNSLKDFRCPKNLYFLTKSYLSERRSVLSIGNMYAERTVSKGCPQGSCCGPGLWNIQYDSLLNLRYKHCTKVIAYADDIVVLVKGQSKLEIENNVNLEMLKISKWAETNKLEFNAQKSKVMYVSRSKPKTIQQLNIYMNNKIIDQVNSIKYLGVMFDNRLQFNEHIENVTEKCTKLIHSLSRSAKINWGLRPDVMRIIYKGAILPLLSYGAPAWIEATQRTYNKMKLRRVQRLVNIKIAKAFRTTSHEALCVITGLTPITISLSELVQYYNITRGIHRSPIINGEEIEIDNEKHYKEWRHPAEFPAIEDVDPAKDYTVQIYTDGSKSTDGVGAGIAVLINGNISQQLLYKLDDKCSNNQAEQLAILKALETLEDLQLNQNCKRTIALYTDSKITVDSLKNSKNHNPLIENIRITLNSLTNKNWTVAISWVKAHTGIYGNELADQLAKQAARSNEPVSYNKVPKSEILKTLREESMATWETEWQATTNGAVTKQYFPSISHRIAAKIPITSGLTTMLTGHGRIKAYFHRFNITQDATCPCNEGDQTVDHLLLQCTKYNEQRNKFRNNVIIKGGKWPPEKSDLIRRHLKDFCTYVNKIDFTDNIVD